MAEVVNLRLARKQRARAQKEQTAAENRAAHGRAKAQKSSGEAARVKEAAFLDAHRRERQSEGGAD